MVTVIAGTNRPNSRTGQIARYYAQTLESEFDTAAQVVELTDLAPEFLAGHLHGKALHTEIFERVAQPILASRQLVWIFPEYNNSYPGVLKAFLDAFPFPNPMRGSVSAMVGVSAGTNGGANALAHWADVLNYLGIYVVPQRLRLFGINHNWKQEGGFTEPAFEQIMREQMTQLLSLQPGK